MKPFRHLAKLAVLVGLFAVMLPATTAMVMPAAAAPSAQAPQQTANESATAALVCGYNDNDGSGSAVYRHCGPTTVRVETTDFVGTRSFQCVAPGDTDLGPTWFISFSRYVGGVNCSPVTIPPR